MIDKVECENRIGIDYNEYLISMWNALQKGWEFPREITREEYHRIKNNMDSYPKELVATVGFCASYNAKWFEGYAGIVHIKDGRIRNYYDEAIRNIEKQLPSIKDVDFKYGSYDDFTFKKALIYCDPPYEGTTKYKDDFDHCKYWAWVREQSKYNIVICSEYNAPEDFVCIYSKELTITLNKSSRKKGIEKLFVHESLYYDIKDLVNI